MPRGVSCWDGGVDCGGGRRGGGSERKLTVPLSGDLVPRVAIAPRVVVDGFFGVHLHVLLAGTAAV